MNMTSMDVQFDDAKSGAKNTYFNLCLPSSLFEFGTTGWEGAGAPIGWSHHRGRDTVPQRTRSIGEGKRQWLTGCAVRFPLPKTLQPSCSFACNSTEDCVWPPPNSHKSQGVSPLPTRPRKNNGIIPLIVPYTSLASCPPS